MSSLPLLSIVTFLPLLGAALIFVVAGKPADTAGNARWIASSDWLHWRSSSWT